MDAKAKDRLIAREDILALLSNEEVARVSNAEDAPELVEGDEYIDLEDPSRGVLQVHKKVKPSNTIPRSAVAEATWAKIVERVR